MKKILISGGHLTPALAVIDQSRHERRNFTFLFFGREFSQESTKQVSHERIEVEKRKIQFFPTIAPKFHKTYWWNNLSELGKWWPALKNAWNIVGKEKPDLFLSFGGYLAVPIAIVCRIRNIPVVTHEQTSSAGLANQLIAFLSVRIAVSYKSTLEQFPLHKTVLTGNPVRPSVMEKQSPRPSWLPKTITKPILYVTGGNQGSEILNRVVGETLEELTSKWFVIHQCGNPNSHTNYEQTLQATAQLLPEELQKNYVVRTWMGEKELTWVYSNARLTVSRSGANTLHELMYHEVPSVLIPLPFSRDNEQHKNAQVLEDAGSAVILQQRFLTPDTFLKALSTVSRRYRSMRQIASKLKQEYVWDGATQLLNVIEDVLHEQKGAVETK